MGKGRFLVAMVLVISSLATGSFGLTEPLELNLQMLQFVSPGGVGAFELSGSPWILSSDESVDLEQRIAEIVAQFEAAAARQDGEGVASTSDSDSGLTVGQALAIQEAQDPVELRISEILNTLHVLSTVESRGVSASKLLPIAEENEDPAQLGYETRLPTKTPELIELSFTPTPVLGQREAESVDGTPSPSRSSPDLFSSSARDGPITFTVTLVPSVTAGGVLSDTPTALTESATPDLGVTLTSTQASLPSATSAAVLTLIPTPVVAATATDKSVAVLPTDTTRPGPSTPEPSTPTATPSIAPSSTPGVIPSPTPTEKEKATSRPTALVVETVVVVPTETWTPDVEVVRITSTSTSTSRPSSRPASTSTSTLTDRPTENSTEMPTSTWTTAPTPTFVPTLVPTQVPLPTATLLMPTATDAPAPPTATAGTIILPPTPTETFTPVLVPVVSRIQFGDWITEGQQDGTVVLDGVQLNILGQDAPGFLERGWDLNANGQLVFRSSVSGLVLNLSTSARVERFRLGVSEMDTSHIEELGSFSRLPDSADGTLIVRDPEGEPVVVSTIEDGAGSLTWLNQEGGLHFTIVLSRGVIRLDYIEIERTPPQPSPSPTSRGQDQGGS